MNNFFKDRNCLSQEEINQYLQGMLDKKAVHEVESHLVDCPLCDAAVEGYAGLNSIEETEAPLKRLDQRFDETAKVKPLKSKEKLPLRLFIFRAAAVIFLLATPVAVLMYWGESEEQRKFASYFDSYPNNFDYSSRNGDSTTMVKEPFFQALQAYNREEYRQSLVLLRAHLTDHPLDMQAKFYAGVAYLNAGQTDKSVDLLEEVITDSDYEHFNDAMWYLALGKLKQGDKERAKSLLLLLNQTNNYYNKKVSDLLMELEID